MKILVIYHANCIDGWVAALQAFKFFKSDKPWSVNITYLPMHYSEPLPPDLEQYSLIYLLDFLAFPLMDSMVVLDHHRSAIDKINALPEDERKGLLVLDMNKSGARLAQEHFMLDNSWLVNYAEDHDLWKFELPNSREIKAGLHLLSRDSFESWLDVSQEKVLETGIVVNEYISRQVAKLIQCASPLKIMDDTTERGKGCLFEGMALNNGQWVSEVGEGVLNACMNINFVINWFITSKGKLVASIRGPSAKLVAELFGGGGHNLAAGFTVDIDNTWRYVMMITRGCLWTP